MQRLPNEYAWDHDGVRDLIRSYVVDHLFEEDGVPILNETGFLKKGNSSAGVQRQYSGTAGRVENCHLTMFAAYVSGNGGSFVDRELYLPAKWTDNRERCTAAGVPTDVGFAMKPALTLTMIRRFHQARPKLSWVAGDEVYGADPELRSWLEEHGVGYALAVARNTEVCTAVGRLCVDAPAKMIPDGAWETYSCADGSKGPPLYDWALLDTADTAGPAGRPPGSDPPFPRRETRTRVLPHAQPDAGSTRQAGHGRRPSLGYRGMLPVRQERGRPRPYQVQPYTPGAGTSPSRCSRTPGWRSPPPETSRTIPTRRVDND
ncbi:FOG: Transposase-like protein [Parafrankia sp. EAN1pec]|nr:FOG: Transposase-like protein [Frankia sp. EAN1pec]